MPRLLIRCMLFVSSYFPLSVIFCIFLIEKQRSWAIGILLVGVTGLLAMFIYFFLIAPHRQKFDIEITHLERHDGDVMSYIASYLIPFVSFPLDEWQQIVAILVFISVLLIVYVNSNMIYINPMLNLLGYHLYEINIKDNESSFYLVSQQQIVRGEILTVVRIGENAFLKARR